MKKIKSSVVPRFIIPGIIMTSLVLLFPGSLPAQQAKKKTPYEITKAFDWKLTPERRAAIEQGIPETKGFIDGTEIVQEIKDKNLKNREERVKLFKKRAMGKYIFFAAQVNPNPFNDNASLNLIFGEGGLMPDFMMVQLRAPKNFDRANYVAKYGGTGYISAFVGRVIEAADLTLDPVYDVFLPGYWK